MNGDLRENPHWKAFIRGYCCEDVKKPPQPRKMSSELNAAILDAAWHLFAAFLFYRAGEMHGWNEGAKFVIDLILKAAE